MYKMNPLLFIIRNLAGGNLKSITNWQEFLVAKFNLNLAFVQLFISSYRLKIRIYSLHYVLKYKIYTLFRATTETGSHKNPKRLWGK